MLRQWPLGGEGGWDYLTVDDHARRLYISRATHVIVLDVESGQVVGDIPDTPGVHGIALAPDLGRGFISNGKANTATIFDLKTLRVLGQVSTGTNPDAMVYDPASRRVLTFNGASHDATVFAADSGRIIKTLALGGKPEFAAADGAGRVMVNIADTSEVVEIDSQVPAVLRRFSVKPGREPTGLAWDVKRHLVFSGCHNQLMTILDEDAGKVIATVPIGPGVDGIAYDSDTRLIFSANGGNGTLTVAQETTPGKFKVVESVPTLRGARTVALDPATHRLYLPTAKFGPAPVSTPGGPRIRPPILKDSFVMLVVGK